MTLRFLLTFKCHFVRNLNKENDPTLLFRGLLVSTAPGTTEVST